MRGHWNWWRIGGYGLSLAVGFAALGAAGYFITKALLS